MHQIATEDNFFISAFCTVMWLIWQMWSYLFHEWDVKYVPSLWVLLSAVPVSKNFTVFFPFCRSCGQIFCNECTNFFVPVPTQQLSHPVRVCQKCHISMYGDLVNSVTSTAGSSAETVQGDAATASGWCSLRVMLWLKKYRGLFQKKVIIGGGGGGGARLNKTILQSAMFIRINLHTKY